MISFHELTRYICICGVAANSLIAVHVHGAQSVSFNSTVSDVRTMAGEPLYVTYKMYYQENIEYRALNYINTIPSDREWVATAEILHYVDKLIWTEKHIRFRLVPHQAGIMVAGAAEVYMGREKLRLDGHEVTVLPARPHPEEDPSLSIHHLIERDGMIAVEAEVSDSKVYAGQPIVYNVYVYDDVFDTDVSIDMPDFSGFWTHVVDDPPEEDVIHHGKHMWRRTKRAVLYPIESGRLQIPAARIAYLCRKPSYEQYGTLWTRPVKIDAVPVPDKGRPDDFAEYVGECRLSMDADKDSLAVDELLTVTMRIEGIGAIDMVSNVPEPDFSGFTLFKQSLTDTMFTADVPVKGVKEWRYILRADQPGEYHIGPVSFPYFNPWRSRFDHVRTQSFTVHIGGSEENIAGDEHDNIMTEQSAEFRRDIQYIKPDRRELASIEPLWRHGVYWSLFIVPSMAWFALLSYRRTASFWLYQTGRIKSIRISAILSRTLTRAELLCNTGDTDTCRRLIYEVIGDLVSQRSESMCTNGMKDNETALDTIYRDAEKYRYSLESPGREWCIDTIMRIRRYLKNSRN